MQGDEWHRLLLPELEFPRLCRASHRRGKPNTPHYASWLNRIEPQFKGLRYFCLDGRDHPDHETQGRLIAGYIEWRNTHRDNPKLRHLTRRIVARKTAAPDLKLANVA